MSSTGFMPRLKVVRCADIVEIKHIMLPPSARQFKDIYVVFELMETDLHQVGYAHLLHAVTNISCVTKQECHDAVGRAMRHWTNLRICTDLYCMTQCLASLLACFQSMPLLSLTCVNASGRVCTHTCTFILASASCVELTLRMRFCVNL